MQLPGTKPTVNELVPTTQLDSPEKLDSPVKPKISIDPIQIIFLILQKWLIIVFTVGISTAIAYWKAKSTDYIYRAAAQVELFQIKDSAANTEHDRLDSTSRHVMHMSGGMFHQELIAKLSVKWEGIVEDRDLAVPFSVQGRRRSNIIDLSVDSKNPEYALDYLKGILDSYRGYRQRERSQINENAIVGLRNEEARVQSELTKIRNAIKQFELENNILLSQQNEQIQASLLKQLQALKTERLVLENQYKKIINADLVNIDEILKINQNVGIREFMPDQKNQDQPNRLDMNPSVADFVSYNNNYQTIFSWEEQKNLLASLKNEYQQKLSVFKTTHPKMIGLKEQINELEFMLEKRLESLSNRLHARYEATKKKENSIEQVIERLRNEEFLSMDVTNKYLFLKNEEAHFQRKYDLVYQRILENKETLDNLSFITIQEPYVKDSPIAPNKLKMLITGPIIGVFLGVAYILLRGVIIPIAITLFKEYKAQYDASLAIEKP